MKLCRKEGGGGIDQQGLLTAAPGEGTMVGAAPTTIWLVKGGAAANRVVGAGTGAKIRAGAEAPAGAPVGVGAGAGAGAGVGAKAAAGAGAGAGAGTPFGATAASAPEVEETG